MEEPGEYYETFDYEEYIQKHFIGPYEENYFWDTLIDKLATRDLIKTIGSEQFTKMGLIERMTQLDELKAQYVNAFAEQGIENLYLK